MEKSSSKRLLGVSLVVAVAASLCCITPILALLAGIGGIASAFSWLEPLRPILIGTTVLLLVFAFYRAYKPKNKNTDCACENDSKKENFINSKGFLWIVALVSILLLTFPYYSHSLIPHRNIQTNTSSKSAEIFNLTLEIQGMTCSGCERHVNHELSKIKGVFEYQTSYQKGISVVKYDTVMTSKDEIIKAINRTGYNVIKAYEQRNE
jgi:copper chaperone CopZ